MRKVWVERWVVGTPASAAVEIIVNKLQPWPLADKILSMFGQ